MSQTNLLSLSVPQTLAKLRLIALAPVRILPGVATMSSDELNRMSEEEVDILRLRLRAWMPCNFSKTQMTAKEILEEAKKITTPTHHFSA